MHGGLPQSLLSKNPLSKQLGPNLLDRIGASIVPNRHYQAKKDNVRYFAVRNKHLYVVRANENGAICFGAEADQLSQTVQKGTNKTIHQQPERSAGMVVRCKANKPAALPNVCSEKESKFQATSDENYEKTKLPKYEWHLVLNHALPEVLTRLTRNPQLNIPILAVIKSTRHYLICRS